MIIDYSKVNDFNKEQALMIFHAIISAQRIGAKYIYLTADNKILGYKEEPSVIEVYNMGGEALPEALLIL
jgi:hypothetical protein